MDIKEYTERLRSHDWYFAMSDDFSVWQRGSISLRELKSLADSSQNHARMFKLASEYSCQASGSDYEKAWRYVGGYLWVHGVKVSQQEAKNYVESKKDPVYKTLHRVDWAKVSDAILEDSR